MTILRIQCKQSLADVIDANDVIVVIVANSEANAANDSHMSSPDFATLHHFFDRFDASKHLNSN